MIKQKKILLIPALILLMACQSENSNLHDTNSQQLDPSPPVTLRGANQDMIHWHLSYAAKCTVLSPEKCAGAYRFSIFDDGKFQVGPAPQGEMYVGSLESEEIQAVQQILNSLFKRIPGEGESLEKCTPVASQDREGLITLSFEGYKKDVIRHTNVQLCFTDLSSDEAQVLLNSVEKTVSKYYPTQFPNSCTDAAVALENDHHSIQSCQHDDDCAYLDDFYMPVKTQAVDSVVTDDCTFIRPLVVANRFSATSSQLKLLMVREKVREVCGERLVRPGCRRSVLDPTQGSPVCAENGFCQINPKVRTQ
jgi:hypothetical protein